MMKRRLFLSALSALARNAIPLGLWFGGASAETALVLYFLETLVAVALAALSVHLRAPAEHADYANLSSTRTVITTNGRARYRFQRGNRRSLIQNHLVFSLGFSLIPGIFMAAFIFLILRTPISEAAIRSGMGGTVAVQIIHFLVDFISPGKLTPVGAASLLEQSSARSAVSYLSCFAGMILAAFSQTWFILPFAVLKTIVDVAVLFKGWRVRDSSSAG